MGPLCIGLTKPSTPCNVRASLLESRDANCYVAEDNEKGDNAARLHVAWKGLYSLFELQIQYHWDSSLDRGHCFIERSSMPRDLTMQQEVGVVGLPNNYEADDDNNKWSK